MLPPITDDLETNSPFFQSILFSIRNVQQLTTIQLHYLYLCSTMQLVQIIQAYNHVINFLIDFLMLDN